MNLTKNSIWFIVCLVVGTTSQDLCTKKKLLANKIFCGFQHSDDFDREANDTAITEFPWIARLAYSDAKYPDPVLFIGIGSLINDRYILTAATCCSYPDLTLRQVLLGEFNFYKWEDCVTETGLEECSDPVQKINVEKTIIHPKYNGVVYENNIALVRLERKVKFSDYICPICLPSPDSDVIQVGDILTAGGWHNDVNKGAVKLTAVGEVMSFEKCAAEYRIHHKININENNVCTARVNGSIDITCAGDIGAPAALTRRRKQWYQEGIIVPTLTRCTDDLTPVIVMKVSNYYDWIENSLEP